jgi:thiamine biosynthesis protein ThiS
VNLTVQGKPFTHTGEPDVRSVIEALNESASYVTVRHNGAILHRRDFENIPVGEGDSVDILHFMGGGAVARGQL